MRANIPRGRGAGNMNDMIRQAQKVQEEMEAKQAEIAEREFSATVGGGVIEVTMTGKKELTNITIQPDVVNPDDVDMLQDLVMAAVNQVIREVEETTEAELEGITGGLNLPGF